MRKEIARSWQRIAAWHHAHGVSKFQLAPGVDRARLAKAEKTLGLSLPEDVRISWELHDGGLTDATWILTYGDLLPVERIVAQWKMYCEWQADDEWGLGDTYRTEAKGPIKPVWWSRERVPVTDNGGNALMIDLDPPTDGKAGQTIFFHHEVGPKAVVAGSWSELLSQWATDLEGGRYVYYPEHGVVAPVGAYREPVNRRRYLHPSGRSWEIALDVDRILTVEIQADGRSFASTSAPGDAEAAADAYDRLVEEKIADGYVLKS